MATLTEGIRIDDVLRWEVDGAAHAFCREKLTVLDGEVISLGELCKLNSASKVIACVAGADDVQTFDEEGVGADGGTMRVLYKGGVTAALAWNVSEGDMQAALRALHADLAAVTVDLTAVKYTITNPAASVPLGGQDLLAIVNDCSADGGVWEGGWVVERTAVGHRVGNDVEMIALEAASPSGADGSALMLMRGPAIVDIDQLTIVTGGDAGAKAALKLLDILALSEPTLQETMAG